jgi:glycosyltransferase involved in cell wall biosynthesis
MIKVLSIENWEPESSWSWGLVIGRLIKALKDEYKFVRIRRGEFGCQNPKCREVFSHTVDVGLCDDFDILFAQNIDTIKMIPRGEKILARIGGMHMGHPDKDRYKADLQRVGAVIGTNKQLLEIGQRANDNCHLIPNGVDLTHFKPAAQEPREGILLGFAGNIMGGGQDYKGWNPFLLAATRLMTYGVEYMYLLHGKNQIPNAEMPEKFYHRIDALVLPSRGEGCSNVVSEALACGVPVLLTKVGFHGEMLTDQENCLFIERNEDSIIEAVQRLINDLDLRARLQRNGRLFAEQYHDVNKIAAKYDEVFKSILQRTQGKE